MDIPNIFILQKRLKYLCLLVIGAKIRQ